MEDWKKQCIGLTVALAVIGVGLLVTAFATDNWVSSSPHRPENTSAVHNASSTRPDSNTGNSSFGLFNGQQRLDYGTAERDFPLKVVCNASEGVCVYVFMRPGTEAEKKLEELIAKYSNSSESFGYDKIDYGLFSFPLWVSVIVALSLAIVMGLVTIGFSVFNVFGRPIETITGPMGLYLWNALALIFTAVTLVLFGLLFGLELSENFMMFDDVNIGWESKGRTDLDYSFYLIVGAAAAFLLNFLLLCLSGQTCSCSYSRSGEKEIDNGMILY